MAEVTVTTEEPGGDSTGVAAGMAVAVAGQAAEDAEVAVAEAQQATETAALAHDAAGSAADAAYNAQEDVQALRAEFGEFMQRVEGALTARPAEPAVVEVTEPAPEPAPAGDGDGTTKKPAKAKGDNGSGDGGEDKPSYGSALYWGKRR